MNVKQLNKDIEYLTKFRVAFSNMVDAMDAIVYDAEIDYKNGNITEGQLDLIRKMAGHYESVSFKKSEEEKVK